MQSPRSTAAPEAGFALILALLALLLLTFLGLTLAVTTSTELQVATNYRWSEQARYVAEAGIEAGKLILRETAAWEGVVPAARTASWQGTTSPAWTPFPAARAGMRDYENGNCDWQGNGMGYGRVLDDGGVPQQYISTFGGASLNGAFTLWVRRPYHFLPDGTIVDWGGALASPITADPDNNNVILVAEGVAPFTDAALLGGGGGASAQALVARSKATYVIEIPVSHVPPLLGGCDNPLSGQKGGGQGGDNSAGCWPLTEGANGSMSSAVQGSAAIRGAGTGVGAGGGGLGGNNSER